MSSSRYEISHEREEEGTYHRREYSPASSARSKPASTTRHVERYQPVTTTTTTTSSSVVSKSGSQARASKRHEHGGRTSGDSDSDSDDNDNFKEWTTSKRKVNHKTRQVETRVSRQLLVRGGEVIADSGPQVVTRITEDNKETEREREKAPKSRARFEALENAPEVDCATGQVLGEKREVQRVTRTVREENMHYHDERFKELTGKDVHRKALQAPHELITINDQRDGRESSRPRGKMVHYSNKGNTTQDTDEIVEVAKLAIDGSVTKERKHTNYHEESVEDERPDEKGEAEALRAKPIWERSSRSYVENVNDFGEVERRVTESDHDAAAAAFPPYEIDPLLNTLRDEDFRPASQTGSGTGRYKEHSLERRPAGRASSSSSSERVAPARSPAARGTGSRTQVEIPEEYRVNKQRLMERQGRPGSALSSQRSSRSRKEDAATQARLTDEEVGPRHSRPSSPVAEAHEKSARYLESQSTPKSSRRYFYGADQHGHSDFQQQHQQHQDKQRQHHHQQHRDTKVSRRTHNTKLTSSSASSVSSAEELGGRRGRRTGASSRDSGFKSPEIYSVSSKHKSSAGGKGRVVSPTPSAGQRSVKTTTTTMSAGLADRPLSRADRDERHRDRSKTRGESHKYSTFSRKDSVQGQRRRRQRQRNPTEAANAHQDQPDHRDGHDYDSAARHSTDHLETMSISSLRSPAATKIQVPYRRVIEIEREQPVQKPMQPNKHAGGPHRHQETEQKLSSESSLLEDIESLSKRLASIRRTSEGPAERQHFDYKTIVHQVPPSPKGQAVGVYNVHLVHQNSPFHTSQPLGSGAAKTNSDHETHYEFPPPPPPLVSGTLLSGIGPSAADNNNESNFSLDHYVKYRATPALVDQYSVLSADEETRMSNNADNVNSNNNNNNNLDHDHDDDDERMSQNSSVSLQSARTYNIRKLETQPRVSSTKTNPSTVAQEPPAEELPFDENGNGKPAAWIFDPRDNSSTAILPPVRPKGPETPQIDSKTEELNQSRGGRSYYLELLEPLGAKKSPSDRAADSLYSRWNSQGALNHTANSYSPLTARHKGATTKTNTAINNYSNHTVTGQQPPLNAQSRFLTKSTNQLAQRRQLPFGGAPPSLGDKSKSSSCLLTVTKPSKYSIYGGFRKPGESNKPVPRLSYSRAIGPRSQRVESQPKTPSRYLKMR